MRFLCLITLCFVALLPALAGDALALTLGSGVKANGSLTLSYAEHHAEEGGRQVIDDSSFVQQYRLVANRSTPLHKGLAGFYNLGLGAAWASVATSSLAGETDVQNFKLLYTGELVFHPRGLPLHLRAYSHDMSGFSFSRKNLNDDLGPLGGGGGSALLSSPITDDISSGNYRVTGFTMLAGARTKTYHGQFRDTINRLPRFLMDYREIYADNSEAINPSRSRDRKLAFISLNKKDNWFHYRFHDYRDYYNSDNNYDEQQVILGTIDHVLKRQWINLTNWLQLSADGSLTIRDELAGSLDTQDFAVNLFTMGRYGRWSFSNPNSYQRNRDIGFLQEQRLDIPFYVAGRPRPDVRVRATLAGDFLERRGETDRRRPARPDSGAEPLLREDRGGYLALQASMASLPRLIVTPQLGLEVREQTGKRGAGLSADLGVTTNPAYRSRTFWGIELGGSYVGGEGQENLDVAYTELRFTGQMKHQLSGATQLGAQAELIHGDGTLDRSLVASIETNSSKRLSQSMTPQTGITTDQFDFYGASLYAEHRWQRMRNRLETAYEWLQRSDLAATERLIISHRLDYAGRRVRATLNSSLLWGDDLKQQTTKPDFLAGNLLPPPAGDWIFESEGTFTYTTGRAFEAGVNYRLEYQDVGVDHVSLGQKLAYHLYQSNGVVRKVFSFLQESQYQRFGGLDGVTESALVKVGGVWYPRYNMTLVGNLQYRYYRPINIGETQARLAANMNFPLMTLSLNYAYAVREAGELQPERIEHLLQVKVQREI